MKHRHISSKYDHPECSADMYEFKLTTILTAAYSMTIQMGLFVLCFLYPSNGWQLALLMQICSCVIFPLFELLLSTQVRFYVKDRFNNLTGDFVPSNTVIVTWFIIKLLQFMQKLDRVKIKYFNHFNLFKYLALCRQFVHPRVLFYK